MPAWQMTRTLLRLYHRACWQEPLAIFVSLALNYFKYNRMLSLGNEQLLQAERAAKAGAWDWDMLEGKLNWSPALFELFDLDPIKQTPNLDLWRSCLHPDDRESAEARLLAAIEKRVPLFNQYRILLKSGQVRWVDAYGDMSYDESGNPVRMSGICIDVTERVTQALDSAALEHRLAELRRLEQQLRDSESRLELALAASGIGLWDYQVHSGNVTYDQRWCLIVGYTQEELSPSFKSWQTLIHPDDLALLENSVSAHMRGDTPIFQSEHRLRHKDGHWVWVLSSGKIVERNPGGDPIRLVGTTQDISSQKRMAQEGLTLLQKFEALIKDVTRAQKSGADEMTSPKATEPLSRRQQEILTLIARGYTSLQIAQQLGIAKDTVATHRRELLRKLNLHSAAELTRYAIERGYLKG